jgi:hypothetical protein
MKKLLFCLILFGFYSYGQKIKYDDYVLFLNKYVDGKGNVDYVNIHKNKTVLNALIHSFEVNYPKKSWSKNEIIAYYINYYNVCTINLIVDNYPLKSIKDISKPWDKSFILLGSKKVSLSYIENNILRKINDPRIHFVINCASISCPVLNNKPLLPENLNEQLDQATGKFINDNSKNKLNTYPIEISSIFDWYKKDFEVENHTVISFINKYSTIKVKVSTPITYLEYNWDLNE